MSDATENEQKGDLAQEILNRLLTDPDFRQQLLDNPAETLKQAGYIEGDDVSGYSMLARTHTLGGKPPIGTTGINCPPPPPPPGTTAIACPEPGLGGGGSTGGPKPKPPVNQ